MLYQHELLDKRGRVAGGHATCTAYDRGASLVSGMIVNSMRRICHSAAAHSQGVQQGAGMRSGDPRLRTLGSTRRRPRARSSGRRRRRAGRARRGTARTAPRSRWGRSRSTRRPSCARPPATRPPRGSARAAALEACARGCGTALRGAALGAASAASTPASRACVGSGSVGAQEHKHSKHSFTHIPPLCRSAVAHAGVWAPAPSPVWEVNS